MLTLVDREFTRATRLHLPRLADDFLRLVVAVVLGVAFVWARSRDRRGW